MKPTDFTAGQVVFLEDTERTKRRTFALTDLSERTVASIGKRWVNLKCAFGRERFDPDDMMVDAGEYSDTVRVWLSPAHAVTFHEAALAWRALCGLVKWYEQPPHLTIAQVREVAAICGFDLDEAMAKADR